jgi:putative CocE/NonD family hydrolase
MWCATSSPGFTPRRRYAERGSSASANSACVIALLGLIVTPVASAQQLALSAVAAASPESLSAVMPGLAQQVLAVYGEADRDTYLDNLFRLHIVAGRYAEASKTLLALRDLRRSTGPARSPATNVPDEVYVGAKLKQGTGGLSFDEAFKQSFRAVVGRLDDKTAAYQVPWVFGTSLNRLQDNLRVALGRRQGRATITLPDAVDLVRKYLAAQAYRSFPPSFAALQEEDDRRRYIIEKDVRVRTPDGATVCALVVRSRTASGRIPALLNFTIYADPSTTLSEARRTASHGYAGVEGLTRGKGCSPDQPIPIEHDGTDAAALIEWISRQAWSDGRVGMYGGSYEGFTQWAAAKHMPKALKAMMPSVTFAPGVDFPMDGNVFMNYAYPWPFYTTNVKALDDATYYDNERWSRLTHEWYVSGRAYRQLDKIDGTPNPVFDRWIDHPGYDAYWQRVIPYENEFARIKIPVLTTTGYYDSGQIGALYYFAQHYKYDPTAEHYLVIGPYDHIRGQRGTVSPLGATMNVLRGYELDSAAQLDIGELRYQWFDYVFKDAPRPALLKDKVNYEVMGANLWKHAPSIAAMADQTLRLHLSAVKAGDAYRLSEQTPVGDGFVTQVVDLADRTDVARMSAGGDMVDQALDDWSIVDTAPNIGHALEFVSDPFTRPTELSGLFSGRLDFITNKADFDFNVTLFELTPKGEYHQLSYYWARASFVEDRGHRRLLIPGKRQHLTIASGRLTSRQLRPGSRLVVALGVIKQMGEQINYGTGKDVSDETIADAGVPLTIRWFADSFIDAPVSR